MCIFSERLNRQANCESISKHFETLKNDNLQKHEIEKMAEISKATATENDNITTTTSKSHTEIVGKTLPAK